MLNDIFSCSKLPNPETHTRLLQIKPGRDNDLIECTLTTRRLEDAPRYCAISYTWGNPLPTRSITINGPPVLVGLNCHYALWQVRQQDLASFYWIDALCINQSDLDEKSPQVQIMGQMFSHAQRVVVSLGEHTAESSFLV